jgi:hypothetical protein
VVRLIPARQLCTKRADGLGDEIDWQAVIVGALPVARRVELVE